MPEIEFVFDVAGPRIIRVSLHTSLISKTDLGDHCTHARNNDTL